MLHSFGKATGGGLGVFRLREDVGWEEGEAEAEVGRREDGQGFGKDVGRSLVAGEVGIELVAVGLTSVSELF